MNITYGEHTVDFASVPPVSMEAILRRGLAHFLGNEQRAKIAAEMKKAAAETPVRELTDEDKSNLLAGFVTKALEALHSGTMSLRAPAAPKADPIEVIMDRIAKQAMTDILAAKGLKIPRKKATDTDEPTVTLAGTAYTMDDLIERWLAGPANGDKARKTAQKELRERAKAQEAAKQKANAAGDDLAALLG